MKRTIKIKNLLLSTSLLAGLLFVPSAAAQPLCPLDLLKPRTVTSVEAFKSLPVLHDGRIKPMDTYARTFLLRMSGRSHYQKESSSEWFARFLFAPRTTFDDQVILINNPEILEAIKVEPRKRRRYTYNELQAGYTKIKELAELADQIDSKNRSVVDREIIRVYSNLRLFIRLSGATAYSFPHPDFTINSPDVLKWLGLPSDQKQFSFYDIFGKSSELYQAAQPLIRKNEDRWTESDRTIIHLMNAIYFWTQQYSNCPIGLIPSKPHENEQWISPMDTVLVDFFDPDYHEELTLIRNINIHYWNGEELEFNLNIRAFKDALFSRISPKERSAIKKFPFELFYNKTNLFGWAKLFYALGFLAFLVSLLSERKWLYKAALGFVLLGFFPHLTALILRVIIMSRPPVSNLYETFIFVGLMAVILGLILEAVNKNWVGVTVASISGLIMLLIAGKFSADGDTMQMLVAVLNSNFWLSTHVIAITTGYSGCSVAGVMGHIYILQRLAKPKDKKKLENIQKNMLGILGFGLTLTFLGTALGGIWADQSWGRFWGWDPKENGALMIVLWSAIIFHARIAKLIGPLGTAAGCVLGLIVVMWAWFGVNLLSVGLHSYGFTSGVANTLILYAVAECVFLLSAWLILHKRDKKLNDQTG